MESNHLHLDSESNALPNELISLWEFAVCAFVVDPEGHDPSASRLQGGCSPKIELWAHIRQNISRVNHLHSAEALLSWLAEPHRILSQIVEHYDFYISPFRAGLLNN